MPATRQPELRGHTSDVGYPKPSGSEALDIDAQHCVPRAIRRERKLDLGLQGTQPAGGRRV